MNGPEITTAPVAAPSVATPLATRAEIAMLTLQLRAAERELEQLQLDLARSEPVVAVGRLDAQIDPLLTTRQRELEEELATARRNAANDIARAHQQVADLLAVDLLPVPRQPMMAVHGGGEQLDLDRLATVLATSIAHAIEQVRPDVAAQRRSYWASARHIDVLLITVATAIVGVLAAAWFG